MTGLAAATAPFAVGAANPAGTRRDRLLQVPAWLSISAAVGLLAAGHVIYDLSADATSIGMEATPRMLVGALLLLAGYAAVFVGLARLFRTHTDDRGDLLDVMLLVSALVAIAWTVLIDPLVDGNASDPVVVSLALMDPILDLVLLGLLVGAVRRHATGAIVCAMAMVFLLLGDIGAVGGRLGGTAVPMVGPLGWLAAFVLLVIGCLRPTVPLVLRVAGTPRDMTLRRLAVLAGAALVPLAMAGVQEYRNDVQEPLAVGGASAALFLVLVARLSGLVRRQRELLREQHRLEASLQRQASEDPLTGLPNRRGFSEVLTTALSESSEPVAVLILDLDDFKSVNDSLGHPAGDVLLRVIGKRLRAVVRGDDSVARLGGDEFAITMWGLDAPGRATEIAGRLLASLAEAITISGRQLSITGSIGIAWQTGDHATAESLLRDADIALYHAKRQGRHRWELFDAELHAAAVRDLAVASEIGRAVARDEFRLCYQPIVSATSGVIESMEALLRWRHPELGELMPGEFLAAAEQSGHMTAIGAWVMREACRAAMSWHAPAIGVNVNIATSHLASDDILRDVRAALDASGLAAGRLTLEILESSFDHTGNVVARLTALRAMGVLLSIDDFGTGFSSLSRVAQVPVTELKLDRSLVAGQGDARMVEAVIRLGQTLGLRLVAEGVETDQEYERVRDLGCDAVQGYRISRPVPSTEVIAVLASWQSVTAGSVAGRTAAVPVTA